MSKRVSLNNEELGILDIVLSRVMSDGGDYVLSGKIGKKTVQNLLKKLGISNKLDGV